MTAMGVELLSQQFKVYALGGGGGGDGMAGVDIRTPSADLRTARVGVSRANVFEASVKSNSLPDFGHRPGTAVSFYGLLRGNRVLRLGTVARRP